MERMASSERPLTADGLHRVVSTSISIFDSAMSLFGEPPREGFTMPGPASIACIRKILESFVLESFVGNNEEDDTVSLCLIELRKKELPDS